MRKRGSPHPKTQKQRKARGQWDDICEATRYARIVDKPPLLFKPLGRSGKKRPRGGAPSTWLKNLRAKLKQAT